MHVLDGKVRQPKRRWYTLRETEEIYAKGGHVALTIERRDMVQRTTASDAATIGHPAGEDDAPSGCQLQGGCIMHEQTGACPLCDEDGADRIAEWLLNQPKC